MGLAEENTVLMLPESGEDVDISTGDHTFIQPAVLYVGTGGNVVAKLKNGSIHTFKNVPDGYQLAAKVIVVYDTSTASDMVGLW